MDNTDIARKLVGMARRLTSSSIKYVGFPKKFWMVIDPKKAGWSEPELGDVVWEIPEDGRDTMDYLINLIRGGTKVSEIYGVYTKEADAVKDAKKLLGL